VSAGWHALERGDFPRAYEIAAPLAALLAMQTSLDAFVVIEKHLLARQEVIPQAKCRGPLGFAADDETLAEVDQLFDRLLRIVNNEPSGNAEQTESIPFG
jgi:4-hydroxy-tetrahydrodipicolinate synthase